MKGYFIDDHLKPVTIRSRTVIKRFNNMKNNKLEKLSLIVDISGRVYFKYDDELKYIMYSSKATFLFEAYYYYLKQLNNDTYTVINKYTNYHIYMFMCLDKITSNEKILEIRDKTLGELIMNKIENNEDYVTGEILNFINFLIDKRLS